MSMTVATETPTALTVDSSPTQILNSMNAEQRKVWRETGATPEPVSMKQEEKVSEKADENSADVKADSSPAAKSEVAVTKEAESAAAIAEPSKSKKNAATRVQELLADNKRLNSELETLRKEKVPVPAKLEEVAKPRRNDVDEKTGLAKYATDEAFDEAYETYISAKVTKDVEKRHAKAQEDARIAEQNQILQQKWQNSLKIAMERHSDFAKVCEIDDKGAFQNAELKKIKTNGMLDAFCLDSEIGGQILYYLASHAGEVARIDALSSFAAARELTKLEDRLSGESSAQPAKKEETPEGSKPRVSGAPAPASNVGGKATAPVDEEEAAVKAEDFRRYMKAANEAEWKAKKKAS